MRVPISADRPSFDHTVKIGFFDWLRSSKVQRTEWARRRNEAARLAQLNQNDRAAEWVRIKQEEQRARHSAR